MNWRIEFKPQDCWIGAFFKRKGSVQHIWICLVPMVPIHVWWNMNEVDWLKTLRNLIDCHDCEPDAIENAIEMIEDRIHALEQDSLGVQAIGETNGGTIR